MEFWARLGRAVEPLRQGTQALALCRNAAARPLSACLDSVDSPAGRRRVAKFLRPQPYPHYEPARTPPAHYGQVSPNPKPELRNPKEIRAPKADSASSPFNLNSAVELTAKNAKNAKKDSYERMAYVFPSPGG